ncbi:MAG: hypothetical protein ACPL7O_11070, partial [Armatimonadota bacterium]
PIRRSSFMASRMKSEDFPRPLLSLSIKSALSSDVWFLIDYPDEYISCLAQARFRIELCNGHIVPYCTGKFKLPRSARRNRGRI